MAAWLSPLLPGCRFTTTWRQPTLLVLLHGFVEDSTTWRHGGYLEALAGRFTLVLVDGRRPRR